MEALEKRMIGIFVDRACPERWIVRDDPPAESPWDHRQPFQPTEDMELEPIPGHYHYVLGIPG